ncbi:hypothetical protein KFU94_08495 [Chloroflexi bacterium TSY]|nr:hypothetical protein [Chloroflexi bacterium TSY]
MTITPNQRVYKDQYNAPAMTRAMALNVAAWTDSSVQAFDVPTSTTDSIWWRQPGGSGIYLGASLIDDQTTEDELATDLSKAIDFWRPDGFTLYDCWASRDLTSLGLEKRVQNPWYLRAPGPLTELPPPEGLSIEIVTTEEQLALFEEASRLGFGDMDTPDPKWVPFSQHHPATLDDPGMTYLNGWLDGQVVSSVIVHATEDMVGIYGLSTLPNFRRRGYAAALVHASVALNPDLPTSVFPDPPSVPIYTRIGFVIGGEIAVWRR